MTNITQTTQLSLFSIIRNILRTNSTIAARFGVSDFYEFEPNMKSLQNKLPNITIKYAETETNLVSVNNVMTEKMFSIPIIMKMEWDARSNAVTYSNAIISQIELSESTFETNGYYNATIKLNSLDDEVEEQKQIIVAQFTLELEGSVIRE